MRTSLRRALAAPILASALAITAAACGSGTAGEQTGSGGGETAGTAQGAVTVQTGRGEVKLDKPATKVVSLEWNLTESLLALGVTPVGNADSEQYGAWVTADGAKLPGSVQDVGTRQEPSLERIKALGPDLIVADESRIAANYDQLKAIAPVAAFDYTTKPQLKTLKNTVTELGRATGKADAATQVNGKVDAKAAELKGKLEQAGKGGAEYALAQGFTLNGTPSIRMLGEDSAASQVLALAGLKNSWTGKPDEWGMTTVGVEGLTKVPGDATFLYVAADNDNPFTGELKNNAVWKDLKFVKDDKAKPLDPGTWYFGGPLAMIKLLDESGKALGA